MSVDRTQPQHSRGSEDPASRTVPAEVLRTAAPCDPWAVARTPQAIAFRGRLSAGTALLPVRPVVEDTHGITFGLANAPVQLKGISGSSLIAANTPWAVTGTGAWRLVTAQPTDLRLIHGDGLAVGTPPGTGRPIRFEARAGKVMRAAITAATPVWIDEQRRPVKVLSGSGTEILPGGWARPDGAGEYRDTTAAFALMAEWALDAHSTGADPHRARILAHIDSHLADPALCVASVAANCGVSRRTLQTMLSEYGGPAAYIRRQRLAGVIRHLVADPDRFPDLDEVAAATGLGSRRTLERAMRQVYGLTPRQARARALDGLPLRELPDQVPLEAS